MSRNECSERGAIVLLDTAPTAASLASLPEGVRAEVARADWIEPFHVRLHDGEVTYYAAYVRPEESEDFLDGHFF